MSVLRVFIGYDPKETVAFHVLQHSIMKHASGPVLIVPLMRKSLVDAGVYTRSRGPTESTEFSLTRFLVPYLSAYEGTSIFMDCDMLCTGDIYEVFDEPEIFNYPISVCKHDYTPKTETKFLGQVQTKYPRKNWSSFMVFNNAACQQLTPDFVNLATGLALHRFQWIDDEDIGSLPLEWNWLVDEYPVREAGIPKVLHYTLGGPWFPDYQKCSYADLWNEAKAELLYPTC